MEPNTTGTAVTIANLSGGIEISSVMNGKRDEINTHTMNPTTKLAVCKGNWIFLFNRISPFLKVVNYFTFGFYEMIDVYNSSNNWSCSVMRSVLITIGKTIDCSFTKWIVITSNASPASLTMSFISLSDNSSKFPRV